MWYEERLSRLEMETDSDGLSLVVRTDDVTDHIRRREASLGVAFPDSFRWYLRRFEFGGVDSCELVNIQEENGTPVWPDVHFATARDRQRGRCGVEHITIIRMDGARLFLDTSRPSATQGECQVVASWDPGAPLELYADNFVEAIEKLVQE